MGSGPVLDVVRAVTSPGGKGASAPNYYAPPGGKGASTSGYESIRPGLYTPPGVPSQPYSQPYLNYNQQQSSDPYSGAFGSFIGNYGYQRPTYTPPPQFYSGNIGINPPPSPYSSPFTNQFQLAGGQFYQQPYSYQPNFAQPFAKMGGRSQYFSQQQQPFFAGSIQATPSEFLNPPTSPDVQNPVARPANYVDPTLVNVRGNDPERYAQNTAAFQALIKGKGGR